MKVEIITQIWVDLKKDVTYGKSVFNELYRDNVP